MTESTSNDTTIANQVSKENRRAARTRPLLDKKIISSSLKMSILRLNPRWQLRNPVMFVVEIGAILVTLFFIAHLFSSQSLSFPAQIAIWLWFTVIFANFAEAMAEGRGKAQAESLRRTKTDTEAKLLKKDGSITIVKATELRKNDIILVCAGDIIPADGTVEEGVASIDESAITGESAPVIRESGGDRSGVTGGTRVLSDSIQIRVSVNPGESFMDHMVDLVESAERQKTPNEIALTVLILGLTLLYLVVVVTLIAFASYTHTEVFTAVLISLLVCLIPTTIGALLSAIGIAGMDRLLARNVIAKSGRAIEAAGDVDVILLDKTGTITMGNRQAVEFIPAPNVGDTEIRDTCLLSSLSDLTPEGRSIVDLAIAEGAHQVKTDVGQSVEFSADTRMSGINLSGRNIRKGAPEAVTRHVQSLGGIIPEKINDIVMHISQEGGTPLLVSENERVIGVIHLKDIVKPGIADRLRILKRVGIRTVMITGDNPITAKTIADEAGVDEFIAEAKPEDKLGYIRKEQTKGQLVAMIGDGTNDAPALAQADVGLAMNSGTDAAREAGNMVDLDSSPTKLIDVIETGKQLLVTRGALTTFSIANDVSKYFAIIPAMFPALPIFGAMNIMHLHSTESAVLSAVIFNAIIIILLIPLALKGVTYRPVGASSILRRNALIYGVGGVIVPFIGIKLIDLLITSIGLA
ncbi:MAG TPA: potassium-transporting ATPase subunit KdpB [Candidatus Thermoplasmatota archaeon]|nr:potassium-transporting ATPase subunit KdpB [Candidatus Thermoplasmatota archaeon]